MKILLVEDDPRIRMLEESILSKYGDINTAVNGQEAVQAFTQAHEENQPYDLICMDIHMPVLDGQQALQQIREYEKENNIRLGKEVKVIMVTIFEDIKNVTQAFFQGEVHAYVTKDNLKQGLTLEMSNLCSEHND